MIIGFTGTRNGMTERQKFLLVGFLRDALNTGGTVVLSHGACHGADDQADLIASELGIDRRAWPSVNPMRRVSDIVLLSRVGLLTANRGSSVEILPAMEPLVRNHKIVDESDVMAACPAEAKEQRRSGTWTTIRMARKRGIETRVFEP